MCLQFAFCRCHKCLINIIGNLLFLEMETKTATHKEYINAYNLWLPQHPYITILNENINVCNYILNEIKFVSENKNR